jgi:hypothetical protein
MTKRSFALAVILAMAVPTIINIQLLGQQVLSSGAPVHMVVTVEADHGTNIPAINREDVMVYQGHDRDQVTEWLPLQGDHAGLDLFLLIDDASSTSLDSQLEDLRQFVSSQPPTTAIYARWHSTDRAEPTTDHLQAAKSLRLPLGDPGASASPYFSVGDLNKRWPKTSVRREILMISDGIDRYYGSGPSDPYVDTAIEQAQRAGITIYSIYSPGVGHYGHSFWRINWEQNYLSQFSEETGGESYYLGVGPTVSFVSCLDDLTHRLTYQYLVTFLAKPEKKGGMQRIKLRTEVPNAELVTATSFTFRQDHKRKEPAYAIARSTGECSRTAAALVGAEIGDSGLAAVWGQRGRTRTRQAPPRCAYLLALVTLVRLLNTISVKTSGDT